LKQVCVLQHEQETKLRSGYDFCDNGGFQVLKGVPKIVVLTNYEDENNLHFFQKLKRATTLAPPSFVVPFKL